MIDRLIKAGGSSGLVNGGSARQYPPVDFITDRARKVKCNQDFEEENKSMLSVVRVHLPSDIPIVGCELTPYVLLRRPDKNVTTDDVPESAPLDGHFLRYKW